MGYEGVSFILERDLLRIKQPFDVDKTLNWYLLELNLAHLLCYVNA
jgi:hypothetical protein